MKNKIKINETHLIVLKKKKNTNSVKIGYKKISNPIRKELDQIYKIAKKDKYTLKHLEEIIKSKYKDFKKILAPKNYCNNIAGSYQGIEGCRIDYTTFFQQTNNLNKEERLNKEKKKKNLLIDCFIERDLPYAIEKTYEKCDVDSRILAYSHRKHGWSMPEYKLVNDFSIQFHTNFGYGSVSYFYTKLKYKKIDIIPFSDWIIYQHADLYEIIR